MALGTLRSKQMIFTLYGDYVRHVGGSIWVGSLVRLLAHFHLSDQSVRSTILRMTRGGWLQVERVNSKSFYSLTSEGKRLLDEGAARIFHSDSARAQWDGKWHLVAYSIPETLRDKRERLRRELGYLGFGMLTNALWVSPHDLRCQVERLAEALDLKGYLEVYTATHDGFSNPGALIARCWNLPRINAQYAAFIEKYQPQYDECRAPRAAIEPSECFVRRFMLIHEYRRFPFVDPELPPELLPRDWRGVEAAKLFQEYHELLANQANAFFQSVFVGPSRISVVSANATSAVPCRTPQVEMTATRERSQI
ncbi:MAG: phenylacetic acid degradation operon negative regulatory protein PaaX [Chloroflexota bacterium]|nr:phenylacetic acid degradation operon negative regulatory protein PaaX [Chloroflexota bacterium]